MRQFLNALWMDDTGSMSVEWAFLTTILVLGAVTGTLLMQTEPPIDEPAAQVTR